MNPTIDAVVRIRRMYPSLADRNVTEHVLVDRGILGDVGGLSKRLLGQQILLVSDPSTYTAAGRDVEASLSSAGLRVERYMLEDHPVATPEMAHAVAQRARAVGTEEAPAYIVAVGAGTVNDISKTAAHTLKRPYISVGTALSMNGYTSAISALLDGGVKRTLPAAPPVAVIIDLDVCAKAPTVMTHAGFGDMLSKPFSEADWRLSHAIDGVPWHPAPGDLLGAVYPTMVADAAAIGRCEAEALRSLTHAVLLSGMAMAFAGVSSPASGGEHLISHYWDMGEYAQGRHPYALHGTQVGVACCLVEPLHHAVANAELSHMDIDRALETWPATIEEARNCIALRHQGMPEAVRQGIITEALKKWRPAAEQRERLVRVKEQWDTIGQRWRAALLPAGAVRRALQDVGGALLPSDIHESLSNDMTDWLHVRDMRSRYTVLDFVSEVGLA